MKNILFYFLLFWTVLGTFACKKDKEEPASPTHSIELLFPKQGDVIDTCSFTFQWQSLNMASDYHFYLSENADFTSNILDTILDTFNLICKENLKPSTKYYWKIQSDLLQDSAMDSFYTHEIIECDFKLIFPKNNEIVDYCWFNFEWESAIHATDYEFTLSEDRNFNSIIKDTITGALNYFISNKLSPGREYFWKVASNQLQKVSIDSFNTRDYLAYFEGSYVANVKIEICDCCQFIYWDTLYVGNITIERISEDMVKAIEQTTGKGGVYTFNPHRLVEENQIIFTTFPYPADCIFDYVKNTFYLSSSSGGHCLKDTYYFTGKKE